MKRRKGLLVLSEVGGTMTHPHSRQGSKVLLACGPRKIEANHTAADAFWMVSQLILFFAGLEQAISGREDYETMRRKKDYCVLPLLLLLPVDRYSSS